MRLGIASEKRARLEEAIRTEDTTLKRHWVAACWRRMAADFHEEPWFWVSGLRKQVRTYVGTRPGDPLADVVFALTFLSFQTSLEQFLLQVGASVRALRRLGGIFGTGEPVQETLPCPAYMDDLTILLEADAYPELLARLAVVTEGTARIASDFGLQLNLAPGKTKALDLGPSVGDLCHSRPIGRQRCFRSERVWEMVVIWKSRLCLRTSIVIWGRLLKLGLARAGRSHRVPTPGRRRRMSCRDDSWALRRSHNTCVFKWPRPVRPAGVCTKRARGMLLRVLSCSD